MKKPDHPYGDLPAQAFWRSAVAEPGLFGLHDLWASRWRLPSNARFATYGSCFAQHISRALVARNLPWINAEPAPRHTPEAVARDFNYGIFSARTANIYTTPQLLILARMAAGDLDPDLAELWETGGRFYDSLRPAIEPGGFSSREQALASRRSMVRAFRRSVERADVFVFTLGLTEGWENAETGQPYAMCPGTVAGSFDAERHVFRNYGVAHSRGGAGPGADAAARDQAGAEGAADGVAGAADGHGLGAACAGGDDLFQIGPARGRGRGRAG